MTRKNRKKIRRAVRAEIEAMLEDGTLDIVVRAMVVDTLVGAGLEDYLQVKTGIVKTH